jgi:hypothetical protein
MDEGAPKTTFYLDGDQDGYGISTDFVFACAPVGQHTATKSNDCDDGDGAISPGVAEQPCNGIDDDCSGQTDEGDAGKTVYYFDGDGDGWGVGEGGLACGPAAPYTATAEGDCCDSDAAAKPGVGGWFTSANQCGSFDDNCDGSEQPEYGVAVACSVPQLQCVPLTGRGWRDPCLWRLQRGVGVVHAQEGVGGAAAAARLVVDAQRAADPPTAKLP